MIRFIVTFMFFAFSVISITQAKGIIIPIKHQTSGKVAKDIWHKSHRSSTNDIVVIYESNNIYIYTNKDIANIHITISDENNNIVYTTITTLVPEEENTHFLGDCESGNYVIELHTDDNYYYGHFEIMRD